MPDNVTPIRAPMSIKEINERNEDKFEDALVEVIKAGVEIGMTQAQMVGCMTFIIQEVLPFPLVVIEDGDEPA